MTEQQSNETPEASDAVALKAQAWDLVVQINAERAQHQQTMQALNEALQGVQQRIAETVKDSSLTTKQTL